VAGAVGGSVALATLLSCRASNRGDVHPAYGAPAALTDAGAELQSDAGGREATPSMQGIGIAMYGAGPDLSE
jgi:hypothetical protein